MSYLSDRSQRTKFGDHLSDTCPIDVGLPQGSVIGPWLFNLYINDLATFSDTLNTTLFCDDSTLYLSDKNINSLYHRANTELHRLNTWVIANRLTINTDKTVAMLFSTRKIKNVPLLLIKNNYTYDIIKRVQSTKFLGILYDENLSFKPHISSLTRKLSKLAGMFYTLHSFLPSRILQIIYNAHVNSALNYNTPIWCCNYRNNIEPLLKIQKRIIRNVTKSDYLAHSKPLFKKSKALNIYDINKLYMGCQFFKNPSKYITPLRANHQHFTRNENILRPIQHSLSLVHNSFLIQGPLNYNDVPPNIKLTKSITSFKKQLKKYLLSLY